MNERTNDGPVHYRLATPPASPLANPRAESERLPGSGFSTDFSMHMHTRIGK